MKKRRTSLAIVAAVFAAVSFFAGFVPLRAYPEIATAVGYILGPMFFVVCFSLVIAEIVGDGPVKKGPMGALLQGPSHWPFGNALMRTKDLRGMTLTVSGVPGLVLLMLIIGIAVFVVQLFTGHMGDTKLKTPPAVSPKVQDHGR